MAHSYVNQGYGRWFCQMRLLAPPGIRSNKADNGPLQTPTMVLHLRLGNDGGSRRRCSNSVADHQREIGYVVRDKEMIANGQHLLVGQKADYVAVVEPFC